MTKEELEKEAEEYLKKKNYTSGYIGYFASGYCKQAYIDSAEPREKRITDLETENNKLLDVINNQDVKIADLESDFRICEQNVDTYYDQLVKATEILKRFIETSNPIYFEEDRQKVKAQAEQFLKDIEK